MPKKETTYTITVKVERTDAPGASMTIELGEISLECAHSQDNKLKAFIEYFDGSVPPPDTDRTH